MAWVVKLGGSLQRAPELHDWLQLIAGSGGGRIVLVPGGGEYADAVRAAQRRAGFDDRTAHARALLAMEKFGMELVAHAPRLVPAGSQQEMDALLQQARVPVWMPRAMVLAEPGIPASWSITSDSLALWLAERLGAAALLLVKSAPLPAGADAAELATAGLVDEAFPDRCRNFGGMIGWLERGESSRLRRALEGAGLGTLQAVPAGA